MHLHIFSHHQHRETYQAGWCTKFPLRRAQEEGIKKRGKIYHVRFDR
jgi:hypothetical protein